ncbi:MAG: T9SS type A sorting domain-containing protein [Bacteroidetes bacterium]|nr:T9SS type A sorting domain-containing protein [Bacteroidota bacterium]
MKRLSILLFALVCGFFAQAQSTITGNLNVDGRNRSYRLRIPPAASSGEPLPLIVSLHGFALSANSQESSSAMNAIADTAGFYVVYPNGTAVALFLQGWNDDLSGGGVDDVAFIDALITELGNTHNVDTSRVFATGFSNGGGMSVALGCALSGRIKAIAPVAAAINPDNAPLCRPASFRPVLQIHGTADAIVPYTGAPATIFYPATAPAEAFFRAWIGTDDCAAPVISSLPNSGALDFSTVTKASLSSCTSGQAYEFYRVVGGDHSIPGPGGQNKDLYSSAAIWTFFRSQGGASARLSNTQTAQEQQSGQALAAVSLWPNPASDAVQLQTQTEGPWTAAVYDSQGRQVALQAGSGLQGSLHLGHLNSGLYQVLVQPENGRGTAVPLHIQR